MNFPRRGFRRAGFQKKTDTEDTGHYTSINVFIPKEFFDILKAKSESTGMPISRLVCYAIDNELDAGEPFHYPVDEPMTEFIDGAYAEEAGQIVRFLMDFQKGLGRDALMLFRRVIGIPSRISFLLGLRELLKSGAAFETTRNPSPHKFNYPSDYKFIRVRPDVPGNPEKRMERTAKTLAEKRQKLEEAEKRLEQDKKRMGVTDEQG